VSLGCAYEYECLVCMYECSESLFFGFSMNAGWFCMNVVSRWFLVCV
jgi:hypothetical protein